MGVLFSFHKTYAVAPAVLSRGQKIKAVILTAKPDLRRVIISLARSVKIPIYMSLDSPV